MQGHNILGVNVIRMGEVTMNGPHQIQNNGSSVPVLRGGIRLNRASLALQNGVQVTGNTGPGIRADQNTGTSMSNLTVSGFSQPLLIGGNGGASISCDSTSLLFSDLTGVAGINCMRIEHALGPARPGRVRP